MYLNHAFKRINFLSFFIDGVAIEDDVTECESFRCYDVGVPSFRANTSCREKANGLFCAFCKHLYLNLRSVYALKSVAISQIWF